MPSRAVVEQFIATIERGEFLEALSQLYAEDMTAQETTTGGDRLRMDEIAYRVWRGDQIVSERYFYDRAQRLPIPTSTR